MQNTRSIFEIVPEIAAAGTRKETNLHVGNTLAFDGMFAIKRTPSSLIMRTHLGTQTHTKETGNNAIVTSIRFTARGL